MKRKQTPPFPEMPADREFPVQVYDTLNEPVLSTQNGVWEGRT